MEPTTAFELDRGTVHLKDVTRRATLGGGRSVVVLDQVSITIPPGSRLAVFADGSETSRAFLNCVAGHDPVSSGNLLVGGCTSWVIGSRMPLMSALTGRDNAEFLVSVYGVYDDDSRELDFIEKLCDLGKMFDEPLEKYTNGMKDRFRLSLSLAFQFDVYPVIRWDGWNPRAEVPFMQQVKRLVDRRIEGRTVLAEGSGSHSFVRDYCSEGLVFKDGRIIFRGSIDESATLAKEVRAARKDRSLSRSLRQHSDVQDSLEDTMNELFGDAPPDGEASVSGDLASGNSRHQGGGEYL
jgi:capsular polysaccharide transport system ATP-binding protein